MAASLVEDERASVYGDAVTLTVVGGACTVMDTLASEPENPPVAA